jgi:imidazolonepropionase-like amidohydrolase
MLVPTRALAALVLSALGLPAGAATCDRSPLVIRNASVWSPERVHAGRDVLVVNGRIREIVRRVKAPADARIIDARGALLLPGFVDSHLHFGYGYARQAKPTDHRWGDAAVTGKQLLRAGVTSGRIHLSSLENGAMLRADSQDDCVPLPRLQAGGPAFIPGAPTGHDSAVWGVTSPEDAADRVRREKAAGFDWIAIHEAHKFSAAERDAIAGTARAEGLRVLGSGYTQPEVESSLALHPDTIDYLDVSTTAEYDPRLLAAAKAQRDTLVWVVRVGPHVRYRAYQLDPARLDDAINYEDVPADERDALRSAWHAQIADRDGAHAKRMDDAFPTIRRKFEQLRASGLTLAAGTDAGSPALGHRTAIWWELRSWVEYGATPKEALTAATVNGARALRDDSIGRLEPGARGDLLLYTGDVSKGEIDPAKLTTVIKGGVLYVRDGAWVGPDAPP